MGVILAVFLIFSYAYSYDLDSLLDEAIREVESEKSEKYYNLALKLFNEGVYKLAVKNGELFIEKNNFDRRKLEDMLLLLSVSYYKLKETKKLFDLYLRFIGSGISKDIKLKLFVYTNNLLVREKEWKRLKIVRKKWHRYFKNKKIRPKLKGVYSRFEPGINIFSLKEGNIIGDNTVYIADKNLTLIEIAKKIDMGYDELKISNPHIDPFDILKGEAVFIPRRRLLPEQNFEFGTVYINLSEKRLYYPLIIEGEPYVISFPVGIGTDNTKSPVGEFFISQKKENPEWIVPKSIREEDPSLPPVVPPGPNNPLGVRAMRLGNTEYLLHGTSKRFGIGMKVSHGCIRMYNRDVVRLFDIVNKGTKVVITDKRFKIFKNRYIYLEIFELSVKDKIDILNLLKERGVKITPYLIDFYNIEKRGYSIPL
ncbi:Lipoprotein-anchoring transpeptidase ErfK/SrfK [Persephonella hydrogeniphila]|uniref:Lipoprotein-anchoring transpeptidase ErfK/SrfK n=1 Tax=Persephonella hydrogeniphila TaxID=198703 RepID=A0A285NAN1_9AQUI|nr:L,D-transpeptidase family protein [Persephonella hydrogeniphila]SNZ06490.1 Lipoprotein-anchoring transpeptidase ErfK/SrfK [Persephonella hydrogeniphila]